MLGRKFIYLVGFFSTIISTAAVACPANLKSLTDRQVSKMDLCDAYDRYQGALTSLRKQGVKNPEQMAGLTGPRFINLPTWEKKAPAAKYSPLYIYDPAPITWKNWAAGAEWMERYASRNLAAGKIQAISEKWLFGLHLVSLGGLIDRAGKLRTSGEVGRALDKKSSLTEAQVQNISKIEYHEVADNNKSLVSWHPTECYEDRTEEFQKQYAQTWQFKFDEWPDVDAAAFYTSDDGQKKQCGYMQYPWPAEMKHQLQLWFSFVNSATADLSGANANMDPILVAARTQRWFVSIHPFSDGNGRMSRYVMDYVLKSLGLPAPILSDMDNDLYSSEEQWVQATASGIEYSIQFAEHCAQDIKSAGCNVVTKLEKL